MLKSLQINNYLLIDNLEIKHIKEALQSGEVIVSNLTKKEDYIVKIDLTEKEKEVIKAGGRLNYVKINN